MKHPKSIELGCDILALRARKGRGFSLREIAAFSDCTWQNIQGIEKRALRKLRKRMRLEMGMSLEEFLNTKNFE